MWGVFRLVLGFIGFPVWRVQGSNLGILWGLGHMGICGLYRGFVIYTGPELNS